jgi:hypothetical protein
VNEAVRVADGRTLMLRLVLLELELLLTVRVTV